MERDPPRGLGAGIGQAIVGYSSASSCRQLATGGGSHLVSPTTQEPQFCFRRSAALPSRGLGGIYRPGAFPLARGEGPTPRTSGEMSSSPSADGSRDRRIPPADLPKFEQRYYVSRRKHEVKSRTAIRRLTDTRALPTGAT